MRGLTLPQCPSLAPPVKASTHKTVFFFVTVNAEIRGGAPVEWSALGWGQGPGRLWRGHAEGMPLQTRARELALEHRRWVSPAAQLKGAPAAEKEWENCAVRGCVWKQRRAGGASWGGVVGGAQGARLRGSVGGLPLCPRALELAEEHRGWYPASLLKGVRREGAGGWRRESGGRSLSRLGAALEWAPARKQQQPQQLHEQSNVHEH